MPVCTRPALPQLLQKVERTCHLIAREEMIADAAKKEGKKKGKAKAK